MKAKTVKRPTEKAALTAKWAVTMAKWRIGFVSGGRVVAGGQVRPSRRWNLVTFLGPHSTESRGVVDILAIRKDHRIPSDRSLKRGDLFEIVLIQVKGGTARRPTFLRHTRDGKKILARLEKKHGNGKALSILAHKIGRAVYYMLSRGTVFSQETFLAA